MKTIEQLKEFLIKTFPEERIYLFGSRARGEASEHSDIDIAIKSDRSLREPLAHARFLIEESHIPYKVDLVELSKAPYLEQIIEKEGIVWH
jgi:predicted nucleotidyltransferase